MFETNHGSRSHDGFQIKGFLEVLRCEYMEYMFYSSILGGPKAILAPVSGFWEGSWPSCPPPLDPPVCPARPRQAVSPSADNNATRFQLCTGPRLPSRRAAGSSVWHGMQTAGTTQWTHADHRWNLVNYVDGLLAADSN